MLWTLPSLRRLNGYPCLGLSPSLSLSLSPSLPPRFPQKSLLLKCSKHSSCIQQKRSRSIRRPPCLLPLAW